MITRYLGVYARGMAMGAADVVPGVSGGTIAFITGIYEQLLNAIKAINPRLLLTLKQQGVAAAWQQIDGNFLLALGLGIVTSILSLARLISTALEQQPLLVWSFFFGLIAASSWHMARQVKHWHWQTVLALIAGVVIALVIGELRPSELPMQPLTVFIAGAIAICAMILPGISGSFILVLLGMYGHILAAIKELNLLVMACFGAGCATGLLSFAHVLSWLLKRFHDTAMTLLTGFLLGSLSLVWPWKQTLSFYLNSRGEQMALEQVNVLPSTFSSQHGVDSQAVLCFALMAGGATLVWGLEKIGQINDAKN